jgi:hypothetical protein
MMAATAITLLYQVGARSIQDISSLPVSAVLLTIIDHLTLARVSNTQIHHFKDESRFANPSHHLAQHDNSSNFSGHEKPQHRSLHLFYPVWQLVFAGSISFRLHRFFSPP